MTYSFRTNGNFIDFVHTDDTSLLVESILRSLHNTSRCVTWSLPEDTTRISFVVDDIRVDNFILTEIDFDGVAIDSQDDFETGIIAAFPGGGGGGGVQSVSAGTNVTVTGTATNPIINASGGGSSYLVYTALLYQYAPEEVTSGELIVGVTYTIISYQLGDDFSNVADVQSGTINESDCVFIATGTTPTNWSNESQLGRSGDPVIVERENTIGDITARRTGVGTYFLDFNGFTIPYNKIFMATASADESNFSMVTPVGNQAQGIKGYVSTYTYNEEDGGDFLGIEIDCTDENKAPAELGDLVLGFPIQFFQYL